MDQRLDFFHSKREMNHLVGDEALGVVYLETDNISQLQLLDPPGKSLMECGRLFKDICGLLAFLSFKQYFFFIFS